MNRRALLIANDSYHDHRLSSLFAPVDEAATLRDLLRDHQIGRFSPADLLVNESKAEIERGIERLFSQAAPGDLLLLYFSGHGVRSDRSGKLQLAVSNTELDFLASTSVSATYLKEQMSQTDAAAVIVLLDCCYSGAITDGFKSDPDMDVGSALRAGQGRYILTATSAIQQAADGSSGGSGQSAFTEMVVRGLSTGEADRQGNGRITPSDLWNYVAAEMPRRSTSQSPTQYGHLTEDIDLARVKHGIHSVTDTGVRVHLGDLLGGLTQTLEHGLRAEDWMGTGRFIVPIGRSMRDQEPAEPVLLNMAQAHGHLAVVGRPGSGKSTLLRTLAGALAVTHGPNDARFIFLESGGNRLGSLRNLPHVERATVDSDTTAVQTILDQMVKTIQTRQQLYISREIESSAQFRQLRDGLDSQHRDYPHPDVFLFIDRWADFTAAIDDFTDQVRRIASNGLEYGLHVIITARGWAELPQDITDLMRGKVELALSQPGQSHSDPQLAQQLSNDHPGWALHSGLRFRVAIPELDPKAESSADTLTDTMSDGAMGLVGRVRSAWESSQHPPLRPWMPAEEDNALGVGPPPPGAPPPNHAGGPPAAGMPMGAPPAVMDSESPATGIAPGASPATALRQHQHSHQDISPRLEDLLGASFLGGADTDTAARWITQHRHASSKLEIPIGRRRSGATVYYPQLPADAGFAPPHTLISGAHGTGKSEAACTIALGLALARTPLQQHFAMLSYRPGSALSAMRNLPHTIGFFDGLGSDLRQYERLSQLLIAESDRRRDLAGQGRDLPALTLICDDHAEMASASPYFDSVLMSIVQQGHELGIQVILTTDRPGYLTSGGGFANLFTERIATRAYTATDSRYVIGIPDAAELPVNPGGAYLASQQLEPLRMQLATSFHSVLPMRHRISARVTRLLEEIDEAAGHNWPQPITRMPQLDALLADSGHPTSEMAVPVGLKDDIGEFTLATQWLALTRDSPGGGQLLLRGEAYSGKTILLRTVTMALAASHPPDLARIYVINISGQPVFSDLAELPQVGAIAGEDDIELADRILSALDNLLEERGRQYGNEDPDFFWDLDERLGRDGPGPGVFLVISGLADLLTRVPAAGRILRLLVRHGSALRIHVMATLDTLKHSPEVQRLSSAFSLPVRTFRDTIDGEQLVYGQFDSGATFAVASGLHQPEAMRRAAAMPGAPAPRVRALPDRVAYSELPNTVPQLVLGVREPDSRPFTIDNPAQLRMAVVGPPGSGVTNTIMTVLRQLPSDLAISLVDYSGVLEAFDRNTWQYHRSLEQVMDPDDAPDTRDGVVISKASYRDLEHNEPLISYLTALPVFVVGCATDSDRHEAFTRVLPALASVDVAIDLSTHPDVPGRATVRTPDERFVVQLAQL